MTEKPEVYRHNGACGVGGDCPHPDHERKWPGDMFGDDADYPSERMLTASEVKVLTETAGEAGRRIGWKAAGEAIQAVLESSAAYSRNLTVRSNILREAAAVAGDIASQPSQAASDATSGVPGHPEVSEAVRSPQEPCGHPACPCASQEAR